jgi:hypothetical protein
MDLRPAVTANSAEMEKNTAVACLKARASRRPASDPPIPGVNRDPAQARHPADRACKALALPRYDRGDRHMPWAQRSKAPGGPEGDP